MQVLEPKYSLFRVILKEKPKMISLETLEFAVSLLDKLKRRAPRICRGLANAEAVTLTDPQEFQSSSLSETKQFISLDATERSNLSQCNSFWKNSKHAEFFPT